MFPNINFQKYQLSKTEIWNHNLVGVLLIFVSFRKDFLPSEISPTTGIHPSLQSFLSIQGAQMMGSSLVLRVAARWGSRQGGGGSVDLWWMAFFGPPSYRWPFEMGAMTCKWMMVLETRKTTCCWWMWHGKTGIYFWKKVREYMSHMR